MGGYVQSKFSDFASFSYVKVGFFMSRGIGFSDGSLFHVLVVA